MQILCLGLSHSTAPIELRERLDFPALPQTGAGSFWLRARLTSQQYYRIRHPADLQPA